MCYNRVMELLWKPTHRFNGVCQVDHNFTLNKKKSADPSTKNEVQRSLCPMLHECALTVVNNRWQDALWLSVVRCHGRERRGANFWRGVERVWPPVHRRLAGVLQPRWVGATGGADLSVAGAWPPEGTRRIRDSRVPGSFLVSTCDSRCKGICGPQFFPTKVIK